MSLDEYIKTRYGCHRGAIKEFLKDNPTILAQELSRWKVKDYQVNLSTGEIYTPTAKKILLKKENFTL